MPPGRIVPAPPLRVGTLDLVRTPGQLTAVVRTSGRPIWRLKTDSYVDKAQKTGNGTLLLQSYISGALMSGSNYLVDVTTGKVLWHNVGIIQYTDLRFIVSQSSASLYENYSFDPIYSVFNLHTLKEKSISLHYAARVRCEFPVNGEHKFQFSTVQLNGRLITLRFVDVCGQYFKTYFWNA